MGIKFLIISLPVGVWFATESWIASVVVFSVLFGVYWIVRSQQEIEISGEEWENIDRHLPPPSWSREHNKR